MQDTNENRKRIEDILNSLDDVRRAEANPFFYTRLMAKINGRDSRWEKLASLISKPAFAIAVVVLFLVINFAVLYGSSSNASSASQDTSSLAVENDYGLSVSSLYDINPEQNDIAQK